MSIVKTFGFSEGLGRDAGTSSPVDTTGSNLIVLAAGYYDAFTAVATVSDSEGNTWTPLTLRTGAFSTACRLWYCLNPTTSATHTFTLTGNHIESGISAIGFSGVGLYDQESGSGNSVRTTTIQPGALTATAPNALYVTTAALESNGYQAIDSGFTISSQVKRSAGNYQFTGIAYFIQTTPAALNPTWSQSDTPAAYGRCAAMATFLAAAPDIIEEVGITPINASNLSYFPQLNLSQSDPVSSEIVKANQNNHYKKDLKLTKNIDELNNRTLYRFGRHRRHD